MQSTDTTAPTASRLRHPLTRGILFWGTAALVIALDTATKAVIRASLERGESWPDADWPVRIRYVTNTGAAFGILQDQTAFLIVMAFIGLGAIYLYYRYPPFEHRVVPIAIGLLLGGAAGNLVDRISHGGRVTDFIDFRFWPAFNVADSSVSIGIVVLMAGYIFLWPASPERPRDADG